MKESIPSLALVVEDDPLQREFLCDLLRNENLDVIQCESAEAAELVVARSGPELALLVTDYALAGRGSGMELAAIRKAKVSQNQCHPGLGSGGFETAGQCPFFQEAFSACGASTGSNGPPTLVE